MTKHTIVITGASSGIGAVAAERLAASGNEVAVVGRNSERTRLVAERIGGSAFVADFDRFDDVRSLAEALLARYDRLDVLVNNAGGLVSKRSLTVDGHERTIQSNHLSPFLLTTLLLPRLQESSMLTPARVISVASSANRFGQLRLDDLDWADRAWRGGWRAYGTSKLATILFIRELAERLTGTGVSAYSVHPGVIATSFGMTSPWIRLANLVTARHYAISARVGAVPLITLAGAAEVTAPSGTFFDRLQPNGRVNPQANEVGLAERLWDRSAELVGLAAASET